MENGDRYDEVGESKKAGMRLMAFRSARAIEVRFRYGTMKRNRFWQNTIGEELEGSWNCFSEASREIETISGQLM